jgi:RNA polymerase sigma factor (sigma-70 family)
MDEIYIKKVCEGDTQAFRYFLTHYKGMAFTLAISVVKDEFVAEEVVQDAFIKAFNGMKNFKFQSKFSTWFYRIVLNEAFMRLKKLKRDMVIFTPDYNEEVADESVVDLLQADEQTYMINEALKMLAPNESLVLRLFYLEEENVKEVCEITGWTESNTKVILHRARKSMLLALNKLMKTSV